MAASTISMTRSVLSHRPIPTRQTVRTFRPRGSIRGRPIVTNRCIDFLQAETHAQTGGDRVEEVGTRILSEQHCQLGEGCTYDSRTDTAWWFDILERALFQAD